MSANSNTRFSSIEPAQRISTLRSPSAPDSASVFPEEISLKDTSGELKKGYLNCPAGPTQIRKAKERTVYGFDFEAPIYYFPDAKLHHNMHNSQCLLMCDDDFSGNERKSGVEQTFHSGAFGREHAPTEGALDVHVNKLLSKPDNQKKWRIVWKFPVDLEGIDGFRKIYTPQPVGDFMLLDDANESDGSGYKRDYFTKYRQAMDDGPPVHRLSNSVISFGAISQGTFRVDFDEDEVHEQRKIDEAISELAELGIEAIDCNSQHHLLVFYKYNGVYINERSMANMLRGEMRNSILSIIKKARLQSRNDEEDIDDWADNFITVF